MKNKNHKNNVNRECKCKKIKKCKHECECKKNKK